MIKKGGNIDEIIKESPDSITEGEKNEGNILIGKNKYISQSC